MENYSFKSVAFGGFDKQDVVRYLEQSSEKAAAAQRELAADYGISRSYVSRIEKRALGKLEEALNREL